MKKVIRAVLALACVAAAGRLSQAADNATEFGIEDDLTVLGTEGTALDPDVEVKGFTVFGRPQASYLIPVTSGNVVLNGVVQVSSGLYVTGGSTFATGAYFTGVSSFSNVTNVHYGGGTVNQVLKKVAGGGMAWGDDNTGLTSLGTPRRLQMVNDAAGGLIDSVFLQNAGDTNISMLATSSMTVLGAFGTGGAATLGNTLAVAGNAQLGDATTDTHAINKAAEAGVALAVDSGGASGNYAAKFYSGGSLAAWIKKK